MGPRLLYGAEAPLLKSEMEIKVFEVADLLGRFNLLPKSASCHHPRLELSPNRPLECYVTYDGRLIPLECALLFCPDCYRCASVHPRMSWLEGLKELP